MLGRFSNQMRTNYLLQPYITLVTNTVNLFDRKVFGSNFVRNIQIETKGENILTE